MTETGAVGAVQETGADWPAIRPEVVAEVVAGLSARLQKRLDSAAAKLAGRPVERTGDDWRIAVDEEAELVLHAPGGVIADQADVRCGCLLAPACVHRAAAVTVCPITDEEPAGRPGAGGAGTDGAGPAAAAPPAGTPVAAQGTTAGTTARTTAGTASGTGDGAPPDVLAAAEVAAVHHLHRAGAAVLAAGVGGAGAVLQAELLRAAHRARLAGLYRPSAAAVAVVTRVRAARSGEPDHRLADLVAALRELLGLTTALADAASAAPAGTPSVVPVGIAGLRGTARQAYGEAGGLRLYGLFSEPVLTPTHAGAVTWAVDAGGGLHTIAEIMPHADATTAAPQAVGAGNRAIRLGDALLSHREFTRAGLAVQGATRSAGGRLGAGAAVRAVRASGAAWTAEPIARLWAEPPAAQVERALAAAALPPEGRPAGSELLFLEVTLIGAVPYGPGGALQLLADCGGAVVVLRAAHDHPGLAHRGNLALLAAAPGLRLRVVGRLERAARPELRLLAVGAPADGPHPGEPALALTDRADRVNLGLERLQRADLVLPAETPAETPAPSSTPSGAEPEGASRLTGAPSAPGPLAALPDREGPAAPVHLLTRRVEQAVTGGRAALTLTVRTADGARSVDGDRARLRSAGLATGAALLDGLRSAAADQPRDVFGRVVADDHEAFAVAWLAAAWYGEELASALCATAWTSAMSGPVPAAGPVPAGEGASVHSQLSSQP
ncbi:hypothetical protein ACFVYP_23270 [Kitasatospora sp. NPDC058201]|uniref:hypothetical protein n=1 Tax=unclassified Kitasatospora TaxID=2633591 RepID=UPI0036597E94